MTRILTVLTLSIVLNNCLWAQDNQTALTDIPTINKLATTSIPDYKGTQTYKATISIDDRRKQDDGLDRLRFLLSDEQGNTVVDYTFKTIEKQFSIDCIDLDNDGRRDFIFIIRENDFSHIHQTLVIQRRVWQKGLKEILSIPYAGQTKEGIKWKYNHSYFKQEDGNIHIMLSLEHNAPNKTNTNLPIKTRWINIADKSAPHELKESEPQIPCTWYFREEEYYIDNLLGGTGYTIRAYPKRGSYPKSERNPLRTIQVVDLDGNVIAERPFRAYFGGYRLALFDIDEDGDMEFIFVLHKGSGTGYMSFEISVDKIVNGQFIPLLTCPLAVADSFIGEWAFSEWKYRGYRLNNPPKVAFEMSLNYSTSERYSERYQGDIIPDSFPRSDAMVLLFEKDKYSINCLYSADPDKRPLSNRKNNIGCWIFK